MNSSCAKSHMSLPCQCTLWSSLYTSTYSQVYINIYIIIDILVHNPMLCKPTYVCAPCECSHFEPFCIHQHSQMCTYTYIQLYTSYHGFICVWTDRVQTYICLWPCECSHLKPLCIHTYIHRYTYFILQKLLYMTPCCANSHMSLPWQVLTLRSPVSIRTYSDKKTHIMS